MPPGDRRHGKKSLGEKGAQEKSMLTKGVRKRGMTFAVTFEVRTDLCVKEIVLFKEAPSSDL